MHARTAGARFGTNSAIRLGAQWRWTNKHRYLFPLDAEIRAKILLLAKPYPKRAASIGPDASLDQSEEGAWQATAALHVSEAQSCHVDEELS
jgi:hypothetical protein